MEKQEVYKIGSKKQKVFASKVSKYFVHCRFLIFITMNLEIKNRYDLIKIFKVISWLDSRRWNTEDNYNFINFFRSDLSNSEKILTHWICYITDRQMPFEAVWDKGGYVFSELVYEFSRDELSPQKY